MNQTENATARPTPGISPLPWDSGVARILDAEGQVVCDLTVADRNHERDFANAALIVRAVNGYDDLTAALDTIAHNPDFEDDPASMREVAREALEKVRTA